MKTPTIRTLVWFYVVLILAACAPFSTRSPHQDTALAASSQGKLDTSNYLLIVMVHGDGHYSFHDVSGKRHEADVEAVDRARAVARKFLQGEVFVFHQTPARFHWFQPPQDGWFYHYRFGRLVHEAGYSRAQGSAGFGAETQIFLRYASYAPVKFFAYFGHEVPDSGGRGYSLSYPDQPFSLAEFSQGLRGFVQIKKSPQLPFALLVLSTCRGGTFATMAALANTADYTVASPLDLHLTYLDLNAFVDLSGGLPQPFDNTQAHDLAERIASQSFDRLKENTQTEITVGIYKNEASSMAWLQPTKAQPIKNCVPGLIDLRYQLPKFGRNKNSNIPHGFECVAQPL